MNFIKTNIDQLYEIELNVFKDNRGWFARTYCKDEFQKIGHIKEWAQLNHSFTAQKGAIRGMHYQVAPFNEVKMVRCIQGVVFDVAIDLRKGSDTFLHWHGVTLSAENKKMFYIPEGFAHGFQTLTDNCELIYHHTSYYKPEAERGIRYDDPQINIIWPIPLTDISERDLNHPILNQHFEGIIL